MAQLRQDYDQFVARNAEILVGCPEGRAALQHYWAKEQLPYISLADPEHRVADQYGQQVELLKLARMPALVIVDKQANAHFITFW